jgi:hypothetical protein
MLSKISRDVPPANIGGVSLKDGRQGSPQTALNRLACAQAANNSPSQIEVDQLPDGDARGGCSSSVLFLGDEVPATSRRAGKLIGPLASLFEAHVCGTAERQAPHLRRSPNAVSEIPRLYAARRNPHRQSFATLIGHAIGRLGWPQSLD